MMQGREGFGGVGEVRALTTPVIDEVSSCEMSMLASGQCSIPRALHKRLKKRSRGVRRTCRVLQRERGQHLVLPAG